MSSHIKIYRHETPYGALMLGSVGNKLCLCNWAHKKALPRICKRMEKYLKTSVIISGSPTPVMLETIYQLDNFLAGALKTFDIPLLLIGTDFQKATWNALLAVPYGQTCSYSQLAKNTGNPKAIRAAASASSSNPLSIIVPCHRIIGKTGKLVGYAGGLNTKERLLQLENSNL